MGFTLLVDLLVNLKKSPNRRYTQEYINLKKQEIQEIWLGIKRQITTEEELIEANYKFQKIVDKINLYLKPKEIQEVIPDQSSKMANFDISTAAKIIPEFDGDFKSLSNFLGLIEFYKDTLKLDQENVLLKFITTVKLSDKVKNRLLAENTPTTIEQLKINLQKTYKLNKNPLRIHTDLATIHQNNLSVNSFATKVEELVSVLNDIQISESGESNRAIIVKLNDQLGLNSFKNGLNEPYKSIIRSARPSKLSDAIAIASEITETPRQSNICHYKDN